MIVVENLTKHYGEVVAVKDVSFEVEEGEVMGFLGPNGAGKSTTIRILTGYLAATRGNVRVDGLDVLTRSLAVRERIGYLPENVPLYTEMRVEEYLGYRARLKGVARDRVRSNVDRAMEQCGLVPMKRRIVGQLSKGYRQRVGLADALVAEPRILILDEPTGGLDPHQRREVLGLIRNLAKQHTILLSSHVLAEIESISDRVMIISRGRLLAIGRPRELAGQLQETPRVRVEARAEPAALRAALGRALGTPSLEVELGESADGFLAAEIQPADGRDPRPEIAAELAREGIALRELSRREFSLEELFLRVVAEGHTESAAAESPPSTAGAQP